VGDLDVRDVTLQSLEDAVGYVTQDAHMFHDTIRANMLYARPGADDTENKLKGFGFGADDYMTKPFHRDELVARIHAIIRRSKGHSQSVIHTGRVAVNLDAKSVEADGKPVHLTGKEYQILELLSLRKGTTLTKEMFLNHLYGGMDEPELKIIDVFICKLRKKLAEATDGENYIETVWGRGYVLRDPAPSEMGSQLALGA
jgi:two-component system cell cycle response regulator CtrA